MSQFSEKTLESADKSGGKARYNIVSLIHNALAYNLPFLGKSHRKIWEISNNK